MTKEKFLYALPDVLKNDESMAAIADAAAGEFQSCARETDRLLIYPDIDNLPEDLLDILAYDFKVDWWNHDYPADVKRQILKDSWMIHRRLGTKWAIQTALKAVYTDVEIIEWYEYGGEPYHFKVTIDDSNRLITPEVHQKLWKLVEFYKNLRSHNEFIEYRSEHERESAGIYLAGSAWMVSRTALPEIEPGQGMKTEVYTAGTAAAASRRTLPEPIRKFAASVYTAAGHGSTSRTKIKEECKI